MKLYNYEFINADEIAKELDPNNTTGGKLTAGRILFKRVAEKFEQNESFILESTLSGKYLSSLIKKAQ
jgi:predicted ABC-type ATPase